jgi:4-hydroxy-tetrahydrodipicolinate synthase
LPRPGAGRYFDIVSQQDRFMRNARDRIRGSIPALITPFRNGAVDEAAFRKLVSWQIAEGSHGLVPCGTTGESPTLSHDEHMRVVEICVEEAAGRVPVIAGAGSNSTTEAISLTRHAKAVGADAVLSVTGYYNKPTQEGLYRHYAAIAEAVDIPILVYNIPGRAVIEISVETMARLSKIANVVGVKDATANLARPSRERLACGKDWRMMSGEDGTALGYMAHGGHGCISVTANVTPKLCAQFQEACMQGAFETALQIQDRLMPLHDALFCEPSPGPVKYAMSQLGYSTDEVRLPMMAATDVARAKVREAMALAGVKA